MNYHIEITRNNVTLAQFLAYCRAECKKKGIDFNINREEFENPATEYMNSYSVIDGVKKCHFAENRTTTELRRKHASYEIPGGFTRYYYTDEYEEVPITKIHRWDAEYPADDAPCQAEIFKQFACDYQCYVLNFDGTAFNEICEFTFDDDKKGSGYYYQANKD